MDDNVMKLTRKRIFSMKISCSNAVASEVRAASHGVLNDIGIKKVLGLIGVNIQLHSFGAGTDGFA